MTLTTLITGGTGKTGRRVAERLTARGVPVRVGSRAGEPPFDWQDPATWPAALAGMDAVYLSYYPDLAFPGAADAIRALAGAAVERGVRRLVLLSGRGEPEAQRGEEIVRSSSVDWTIVQSSMFAQNFSEYFLLEPVRSGIVAFPAGDMAEPFIDVEDIADVAAAALTEDRHAGRLYEVTGPRLLTFAEAVAEISAAIGREVRYQPITPDEYYHALTAEGMPPDLAVPIRDLFGSIFDGRNAYVADGVRQALGREPRDFRDYVRDAAATGVWG
jgi:uncharacterized protein YbjT (DUF2867 family)